MNKTFKPNYFSRDFSSIKQELTKYASRYYSDTLSDLSEAGINAFMIDSVAYVGDVLSYYLDYQTNETFLPTARDPENILNLAKTLGYKPKTNATSAGKVALYMLVPDNGNGPDYSKLPIIKKGTVLSSTSGNKFLLAEDIKITESLIANYVVARVNNVGRPLYYAIKTHIPVVSGRIVKENYTISEFEKFKKLFLNNLTAVEIISVQDSEGNYYYEVPNLSQNIVYTSVHNPSDSEQKYMLKPVFAQRRFVFDYENGLPYLLFGAKQYKSDDDLLVNPALEPNKYLLNKYNNDHLQDGFFEPNKLINGDSYGIGPEDTVLTISYRVNEGGNSNISIGTLTNIDTLLTSYSQQDLLDPQKSTIIESIEITNEEPIIGDTFSLDTEEIRDLAGNIFAAQGRAVSSKDYETLCYMMPQKYGALKRVKVERDASSLKNNINIYTVCQNFNGKLVQPNSKIKENLKTWLSQYKIITDTVDILDAKIVNIGIHFVIMIDPISDKIDIMDKVKKQLINVFSNPPQIGQAFNVLDIYRNIRKFKEVLDIKSVTIFNKTSAEYSKTRFSIDQNYTSDKTIIKIPKNVIYEIKYPEVDITGDLI